VNSASSSSSSSVFFEGISRTGRDRHNHLILSVTGEGRQSAPVFLDEYNCCEGFPAFLAHEIGGTTISMSTARNADYENCTWNRKRRE
jgi:hypothetical protein